MLNELLKQSYQEQAVDPERCLTWVSQICTDYLGLQRGRVDADQLIQLKFAVIFWRSSLLRSLIQTPPAWAGVRPEILAEIFTQLNTYITEPLRRPLAGIVNRELFASLMAQQGLTSSDHPQHDPLAGPGIDLQIVANRSSSWPYERWRKIGRYGAYRFDGDGVQYRGILFRPGDVLLANVNLDGNGIYTALSDPRGFSSHSAFFAILQDAAGRYPAVIETYEKGVRAVPLNVFLGPRFSAYVEVYRYRELSSHHTERINAAALAIMREVNGYNFDSEDTDRQYMSCTSVGRFLHSDAGLRPVETKSYIRDPQIVSNLERLGYTCFSFFAPVDYMLDEKLQCVGWVDNNQFQSLLARELVDRKFRSLFSKSRLNPERFPSRYRVNLWAIGQIRRGTLVGRLISMIEGFDKVNLPKGPDTLLAVITLAEAQLGRSIRKTEQLLSGLTTRYSHFDLDEFLNGTTVTRAIRDPVKLDWLERVD